MAFSKRIMGTNLFVCEEKKHKWLKKHMAKGNRRKTSNEFNELVFFLHIYLHLKCCLQRNREWNFDHNRVFFSRSRNFTSSQTFNRWRSLKCVGFCCRFSFKFPIHLSLKWWIFMARPKCFDHHDLLPENWLTYFFIAMQNRKNF